MVELRRLEKLRAKRREIDAMIKAHQTRLCEIARSRACRLYRHKKVKTDHGFYFVNYVFARMSSDSSICLSLLLIEDSDINTQRRQEAIGLAVDQFLKHGHAWSRNFKIPPFVELEYRINLKSVESFTLDLFIIPD